MNATLTATQDAMQASPHEAAARAVAYLEAHGLRWLSISPSLPHQAETTHIGWPVNATYLGHDITVKMPQEVFDRHFAGVDRIYTECATCGIHSVVEDRIQFYAEFPKVGTGPMSCVVKGKAVDCG